jgi:hypothetical protein
LESNGARFQARAVWKKQKAILPRGGSTKTRIERSNMKKAKKTTKSAIKVRDLKPKKDAKGGSVSHRTHVPKYQH